jgi:hypothetical protein
MNRIDRGRDGSARPRHLRLVPPLTSAEVSSEKDVLLMSIRTYRRFEFMRHLQAPMLIALAFPFYWFHFYPVAWTMIGFAGLSYLSQWIAEHTAEPTSRIERVAKPQGFDSHYEPPQREGGRPGGYSSRIS